ncbi:peptide chain release factor 1 [Candidatus Contubernalis alkaliaceticus]|uniref:peptide chain release factor 1 n=1 Tax=Candidatus Contubernalis alkaliaceticus TaxID=338645 RepID=UPI001F4BE8F6|nr:peptide chain release factor 1 [Candidatus Contubernalis alkalaceticus]
MLEKLQKLEDYFLELEALISDPEIINRQQEWQKYTREHSRLSKTVEVFRNYKIVNQQLIEAQEMQNEKLEEDMALMVKEEVALLSNQKEQLDEQLKILLIPKDPFDEKDVIVEIRAGTGGDEAALFAGELFRMYARYAERRNWKLEILNSSETDIGGFKEIVFMVEGEGAYSCLKYESGVHRVQRVPATESSGRIHTSAATVAVLPEAEEVEVEINPQDLRIDTFCSTGPGGQSVNTTKSAVRITHVPTNIVASCQDEKSQHKNRDKAMKVLRTRLLEVIQNEHDAEMAQNRKSQVGSGDRSERIRTYNFPQGRVTDHRVGLTLHKLDLVLDGDIGEFIEKLAAAEQEELLKRAQ